MRICPQCQSVFQEDGIYCPHDRAGLLPMRADDGRCGTLMDGRFLVLSRLGRGGMGTVYRAWQLSTDRQVALKLLSDSVREEPVALERFLREARVTASLRCPHTVRVFDFGQLKDATPYLAMELVDGVTLDALIADIGPMAPARAIELVRQICLALEEAHGLGLIHRDLKPSNIMVSPVADGADFARVLDFGVAKMLDDDSTALTAENSNPGTPAYMAPEQARSEPVGPPADIYAVAVMMYEMLAGVRPFTGTSAVAVLVQHAQTPPPRLKDTLPGLPGVDALDAVLQRGLAKRPVDRYSDAASLRGDLDRLRSGTSPLAALAFAATAEGTNAPALPGKKRMLGLNFQALGCSVQLAIAVGALALFVLPQWRDEAPGVAGSPSPALERVANEQPAPPPPPPRMEGEHKEAAASLAPASVAAAADLAIVAPVIETRADLKPVAQGDGSRDKRSQEALEPAKPPEKPYGQVTEPSGAPAPPPQPGPFQRGPGANLKPENTRPVPLPLPPGAPRKSEEVDAEPDPQAGDGPAADLNLDDDRAPAQSLLAQARARLGALRSTCGAIPAGSVLQMTIQPDGRVWVADPVGPGLERFSGCLKRTAGAWIFAPAPAAVQRIDLPLDP